MGCTRSSWIIGEICTMAEQFLERHVSRRRVLRGILGASGLAGAAVLGAGCSPLSALSASPAPLTPVQARVRPAVTEDERRDGDIVLGMSAAFRGSSRALGIELYRGAMAYLSHINASGGINGRRIVIAAQNDGYQPTPALDNTIGLIEQEQVFLLWNYVGTPTVTRVLPLFKRYQEQEIYLFCPFTGAQAHRDAPYDRFVFNLRASYRQETAGLVDHLVQLGRTRFGVFFQADAYGRSGWDGVRRALAQHDLAIVSEATYRRGAAATESMAEQVQILQQGRPDAIICIGAYAACGAFIRDLRDAGWQGPIANVSFVGSESLLDLLTKLGQAKGKDYTRQLINSQVVPSYEDTTLSGVKEYRTLIDTYDPRPSQQLLDDDYTPAPYGFVSFEGFLNAKLMVEMLRHMGSSPTRAQIPATMEAMQNVDLGIGTPVSFAHDRHQGLDAVYYTTVDAGRFVPITDWKGWLD